MQHTQSKSTSEYIDKHARGWVLCGLRLYRRCVSPYSNILQGSSVGACRFWPSCSAYAEEAFTEKHFFPAAYLTIRRVIKCRPRSEPGFDPVV